ncbi:MAG: response regulator transcription factor [Bacteroidales bacterium]|jgi:DNA-binding response OmpR family regulator|nr:response regulator transcription factor [Bacteroidales bacterium]
MMKILVVEDEVELLIAISNFLSKENYICELAENYKNADEKLSIYEYDIILIDISLPDGNGLKLLDTVRKHQKRAGVIIISARNSLDDKIMGLDLGADDYLTKPFHLTELNSRIKALLRRKKFDGTETLTFNEISVSTSGRSVTVNSNPITLTRKEYDLLLYFIINRERVLTKEAIAEHLWEDNIDMADSFDFIYTHLNNIRRKIREAGGTDYIRTIYGSGYKFSDR